MEWFLELALSVLLAATLFHALRLERALGVLKQDRAALEALVDTFNASTKLAEQGVDRLRVAADGAGKHIARHTEVATELTKDLQFLIERGERVADRLEACIRVTRDGGSSADREQSAGPSPDVPGPASLAANVLEPAPSRVRSQAERDLLRALGKGR
ncbi:MAG: hypothetical protein JOY70_03165 [Acidisphaera sp.]|nr:hypothetical protein [Acidisphaera sp.]